MNVYFWFCFEKSQDKYYYIYFNRINVKTYVYYEISGLKKLILFAVNDFLNFERR